MKNQKLTEEEIEYAKSIDYYTDVFSKRTASLKIGATMNGKTWITVLDNKKAQMSRWTALEKAIEFYDSL